MSRLGTPRSSGRWVFPGLILGVLLVVGFTHAPVLSARALSFDDGEYLLSNPLVQRPGAGSVMQFLAEVRRPSTVAGYYQPLAMISLMVDYAIGGRPDNLYPFHRTSLILHLLNVMLLVLLLQLLFETPWAAALAGLLYGVHPLAVEPLAWVGERKTLLATFFAMASMVAYVKYAQRGHWQWLGGSVVVFVLALMSKPTVTPLPLLLLLLDYWPLNRLNRRALVEKVPFLAIAFVFALITVLSQGQAAEMTSSRHGGLWEIPLVFCHNTCFYLVKMVYPVVLTSIYPFPEPLSMRNPLIAVMVAGTVILTAIIVGLARRTRGPLVAGLFFSIAILPTQMTLAYSVGIAADKYVYLPAVGVVLLVAWALARAWQARWSRVTAVGAVALLVGLAARQTRGQLRHWQTTESLQRHILRFAPGEVETRIMLGLELKNQGRIAEAIDLFREVIALAPQDFRGYQLVGDSFAQADQLDDAISWYRQALRHLIQGPRVTKPEVSTQVYNNLAIALARKGLIAEATPYFEEAVKLGPNYPDPWNNLGSCYVSQDNLTRAIESYQRAVAIKPGYLEARRNLARALLSAGRVHEAIAGYRAILSLYPDDEQTREGLRLASETAAGRHPGSTAPSDGAVGTRE